MMKRLQGNADLFCVIVAAFAATLFVILNLPVLRQIGGLMLLGFLPGYAFVCAVILPESIDQLQRLGLGFALSIPLTVIGGFVIDQSALGLRTGSWLFWLNLVIYGFAGIALTRRARRPLLEPILPRLRISWWQVVMVGAAVALVAGAIVIARNSALEQRTAFTELWIKPLDQSQNQQITVGFHSMEFTPKTYTLEVEIGGTVTVLHKWEAITLKPGESWQMDIPRPEGFDDLPQVVASLYLSTDLSTPYRQVFLNPGK